MLLGVLRAWRVQNIGALFIACYAALGVLALRLGPGHSANVSLVMLTIVAIFAWLAALRRARAMTETATSRIASAAQGYAEVMGRASVAADNLIVSPMSGVRCIWYRYHLYSKDNAKHEWREIDSGVSSATFEIADETGVCRVDPDHAEVINPDIRTTYTGGNKLVEELLFGGCVIYVLGDFVTLGGAQTPLSVRDDVSALLADWKKDPAQLKRRFDLDGNGQLDVHEWELARKLAIKTVEKQHLELRNQPGIHMVRAPQDTRLFLISALSPMTLRRRFYLWSYFHLAIGFATGYVLAWQS